MKSFEEFLATVETSFPLNILKSKCCLSVSNSGRRGGEKAFSITVESLEQSLRDIKKNINSFPCDYDEATWRDNASKFLTDNHARTLCGTQTKPFYETINKVISWANEQTYADGELNLSAERIDNALIALEQNLALIPSSETQYCQSSNSVRPDQIIYYGVPGCGKSNKIDEMLKSVDEKNKIRVVFHPEYTNADFVGQILPNVDGGGVNYRFTPGPFSRILKRAYLHPDEQFYLVIEEINRGNAAAIFGDIFQLLDRLKDGETDDLGNGNVYSAGWSQYFVQNDDINTYLRRKVNEKGDDIHDVPGEDPKAHLEGSLSIDGICFSSTTAIRLPPNLSIYATMNTSDQNVFTLDNAFQRRFDMELVRNEFGNDTANDTQKKADIAETGVSWGEFWEQINKKIGTTLKGLASTEDKRLGVWFVKNDNGKIDKKVFAEKVLKYLWDDVFKFKRKDVFANDVDSLEKLVSAFYEHGFSDKVFKGWPWPQETASEESTEA